MTPPLLITLICFLAAAWIAFTSLRQQSELVTKLSQTRADLTDAEQALNVLIHERGVYKDENARLRRIAANTAAVTKASALFWADADFDAGCARHRDTESSAVRPRRLPVALHSSSSLDRHKEKQSACSSATGAKRTLNIQRWNRDIRAKDWRDDMQLVYLLHPFGGNLSNADNAERWCAFLNFHVDGAIFQAPWVPMVRHWQDSGETRKRGLALDVASVKLSGGALAVTDELSPGMKLEWDAAESGRRYALPYKGTALPVGPNVDACVKLVQAFVDALNGVALSVWYDGSTYVVAHSADEAKEIHCAEIGEDIEDCESEFKRVDPADKIAIFINMSGDVCSDDDNDCTEDGLTLTAAEWIARELPKHDGKPFCLCSEDC